MVPGQKFGQITSNIILIDALLEHYGPDTHDLRVMLRGAVGPMVDLIWGEGGDDKSAPFVATRQGLEFVKKVRELEPNSDAKRAVQARVINAVAGQHLAVTDV